MGEAWVQCPILHMASAAQERLPYLLVRGAAEAPPVSKEVHSV